MSILIKPVLLHYYWLFSVLLKALKLIILIINITVWRKTWDQCNVLCLVRGHSSPSSDKTYRTQVNRFPALALFFTPRGLDLQGINPFLQQFFHKNNILEIFFKQTAVLKRFKTLLTFITVVHFPNLTKITFKVLIDFTFSVQLLWNSL